ncbi:MAG: helix-turn-helix domain-containing protein, partial [Propionibacteriaceae bacterium]
MVTTSPFIIVPAAADLIVLTSRATSARAEHRQVIRARIVLAAAQGQTNAAIAADLELLVDTVRKWRYR